MDFPVARFGLRELRGEATVLGELLLERRALVLDVRACIGRNRCGRLRARLGGVRADELLCHARPRIGEAFGEACVTIVARRAHAMGALERNACLGDRLGAELLRVRVALEGGERLLGHRPLVTGREHEPRHPRSHHERHDDRERRLHPFHCNCVPRPCLWCQAKLACVCSRPRR